MSARLPFHILPTATILAAPYPSNNESPSLPPVVNAVQTSVSSGNKSVQSPKLLRYLDDEQGKKVIALIHARGGTISERVPKKHPVVEEDEDDEDRHQKSYYVTAGQQKTPKKKKSEEVVKDSMDLIDKMNSFLKIDAKGLVKYIDLEVLVENEITLEDLISLCDVGICDLKAAGIVENVKHLCALRFKMSDLVLNRELFRAQHLADLFQLTYAKLSKMKGIKCNTYNLLSCQFYPNELSTLSFSFDKLINSNLLNAGQLLALNFTLADLISLNFTVENFRSLGISRRQALDEFGWDRKQYADFTGEPEFHRKKKV